MLQPKSSRELNSAINDMAKMSKKTIDKFLPKQIRLLMVDFAKNTEPFGVGDSDEEPAAITKRLEARMRNIYPHPSWVVNMVKARDPAAGIALGLILGGKTRGKKTIASAQQIIDSTIPSRGITIGTFDKGALHNAQRGDKGVKRRLLCVNRKGVDAYTKRTLRLYGFAKAGFANASKSIGGARGIPGWAKRNKVAPGNAIMTGTGSGLTITVTNGVRHIRKALTVQRESVAMRFRATAMTLEFQRAQDAKLKKRMERANRSL